MVKPIKIYGESKSGTTYLEHLLEKNTDAEVIPGSDWSPLGWKHGFPQHGDALFIFIFRNVYETAKSLLADSIDKRFHGIAEPFGNITHVDEDHWKNWDHWIECRTAKYYSYIGFAQVHEASWLLSYDYLKEDTKRCIGIIDGGKITYDFQDIPNHTYKNIEGRDNPDRRELIKPEIEFINSKIDPELESFVDNLTIQ